MLSMLSLINRSIYLSIYLPIFHRYLVGAYNPKTKTVQLVETAGVFTMQPRIKSFTHYTLQEQSRVCTVSIALASFIFSSRLFFSLLSSRRFSSLPYIAINCFHFLL